MLIIRFIPGLALSVLFLALSGLFQALAMPRLLTTLATLALALALMFLLLLGLYVSCCEVSFFVGGGFDNNGDNTEICKFSRTKILIVRYSRPVFSSLSLV